MLHGGNIALILETTVTRRPKCQIQRLSGDDILQFVFKAT